MTSREGGCGRPPFLRLTYLEYQGIIYLEQPGINFGISRERVKDVKVDKGLMAGSSTMLVLKLLESGDMYGYQMIEELFRRSNQVFQMQEGTLYPILHTLEKGKYLSSYEQQAPTGRMRKYYKLTRKGRKLLGEKKSEWEQFHRGVDAVLSFS